jgi:hypothetical protein
LQTAERLRAWVKGGDANAARDRVRRQARSHEQLFAPIDAQTELEGFRRLAGHTGETPS